MATSRTIIIAGAGIGGLTASLALAAAGFRVVILEREARLEEAGAGLQLSPNASRVLINLGLEEAIAARALVPEAISMMTARSGKEVGRILLGETAGSHYGAPYWLIRRADLQAALLARVDDHPAIALRLGASFEDVMSDANGVTVIARQGAEQHRESASALIGADGVRSAVRQRLFADRSPHFTSRIAWRGMIDARHAPHDLHTRRVQLWMGPNAHLVAYPLADGKQINLVAVLTGAWNGTGWSEPGEAAQIVGRFAPPLWPPAAHAMISAVRDWRKWALFAMPDGGAWAKGHVALLGDAAHAMLPFVAQGAGMAIEDAAVLARCCKNEADIGTALARYAAERAPRVAQVVRTARQTGQIYHLRGPMAFARDRVIGALGGKRLLARQDWIYAWRG